MMGLVTRHTYTNKGLHSSEISPVISGNYVHGPERSIRLMHIYLAYLMYNLIGLCVRSTPCVTIALTWPIMTVWTAKCLPNGDLL